MARIEGTQEKWTRRRIEVSRGLIDKGSVRGRATEVHLKIVEIEWCAGRIQQAVVSETHTTPTVPTVAHSEMLITRLHGISEVGQKAGTEARHERQCDPGKSMSCRVRPQRTQAGKGHCDRLTEYSQANCQATRTTI